LDSTPPELKTKPFDSFLNKTFRKNVVNNIKWPEPPDGGWILPNNWFQHINDMVRTYLVVKYLDGVNFLVSNLEELCYETECPCKVDYEAKQEGYYAAHVYVSFTCDIPRPDWDTKKEAILFEIQITTQLQEVIRRLLHKYYERRRAEVSKADITWQWDYKSEEFAANYLGHILHYVEGMIMDVRDKKLGKGGPE
jgi:ppGpp synthetase/RelA/SpoT-type nucleotidyltranferase